jgi:hypothetical protein
VKQERNKLTSEYVKFVLEILIFLMHQIDHSCVSYVKRIPTAMEAIKLLLSQATLEVLSQVKPLHAKVDKHAKVEVKSYLLESAQRDTLACYVEAVSPNGIRKIGSIAENAKIWPI